jgi:UDP-2,3-diacylglucosamine pyrophosphatase LpxH
MKTIVVSDIHLGSKSCDRQSFDAFLTSLREDKELTDLVVLGDFVDMWRRDASGVFLENMDTLQLLKDLRGNVRLHFVAGNHDYHLLRLRNTAPHYNYPFEFRRSLDLHDGVFTYRFVHGYEFEYGKERELMDVAMEVLCHVMSDSEGIEEEEFWTYLIKTLTDLHFSAITKSLEGHGTMIRAKSLREGPETRLKDKLEEAERKAHEAHSGASNEILVFGHTHHPFINSKENVVNTGSWVHEATPHNTYVELTDGKPRLFVFGEGEVLDRLDSSTAKGSD